MRVSVGEGRLRRLLSLSIGVATALSLGTGTAQPSWAAARAATSFLPLHVGGLFGFSAKEEKESPAPIDVAPAARPTPPAAAPETPPDPLAFLNAYLPRAGEWARVQGLDFDDYRLSDLEANGLGIRGTVGSASVLTNGTGSAFDAESLLWYFWGGGGDAYGGNEVYRLDLAALSMARASAPSALDSSATGAGGKSCPVPFDAPSAASTHDGMIWSPLTQSFFAFPMARYCADDTLGPDSVWEFDPASGLWTEVTPMTGIAGPVMAEYDSATDKIMVVAAGNDATVREFDPVTGQFGDPGHLGQKIGSGTAVLDPGGNRLIVFSPEGVFGVPLANLGSIQSLGALPVGVDPSAGAVYDSSRGLVVLWAGGREIRTFDPATQEWTVQTPASGPTPAAGGVYSKWIFIEPLRLFAGYQNPAQGLWLYRLPNTINGSGPANSPPFADAGQSQRSVRTGRAVTISGAGSFDIDLDPLTYSWTLLSSPQGSVPLTGANSPNVTFTPNANGDYRVRLTVSDGALSDTATVTVTAGNGAPVANAGPDASQNVGQSVQLNGGASFDPDGDTLSYTWKVMSRPTGSTSVPSSTSVASPSLMLDAVGAFVLQLTVSDGNLTSAADTVTIAATALAPAGGGTPPTPNTPPGGGSGGTLAQVAASLGAGQSATLATQNINAVLRANGASRIIFGYTDNIQWNPVYRQLQFLGGDHNDVAQFVIYDEATNTWINRGNPSFMGGGTKHGYDHMSVDPASGDFFSRLQTTPNVYRWNGQAWSTLPPVTGFGYPQNIALAIEYFPEMNGLLWAGVENGTLGGAVLWDRATNSWRRVAQNLPMGSVHHVAEYNPVYKLMIFGGGNGSKALYSLDAQGTVKTLAAAPHEVGIQSSIITVDPVGGDYLVFFRNGEFWTYNPASDHWARQATSPPIWSNFDPKIHGVVATPVGTYGVNLFVTCMNAGTTDCRVTVYKHSAGGGGTPAPTPAPTVSLSASPSTVTPSQFTTLTWSFTNAASCAASAGWSGTKVAGGSQSVAPAQTTTYTLTCTGAGGSASQSVTVNVNAQPPSGGGGPAVPNADFAAACAESDIILCRDFDTLPPDAWQGNEGIFVNGFGDGCASVTGQARCPSIDNGRLKFTFPTNSGGAGAGQYFVKFPADEVMPGQSLYVRWEQEFDAAFLNQASQAGDGFKIAILGDAQQSSCSSNDIVLQNVFNRGFVQAYHACGLFEGFTGIVSRPNFSTPDFDYQPGGTSSCLRSVAEATGDWGASCYKFVQNETMVFEIAVDLNADTSKPSRVRIWITSQSRGRELAVDFSRVLVDGGSGYGAVWLLPYNTNKNPAVAHPTANTWINNLVVARRTIP